MKKNIACICLLFAMFEALFASPAVDEKVSEFFNSVQKLEYNEGIDNLLEGSVLISKLVSDPKTKTSWIDELTKIRTSYGDYLSYEKIKTIKLGKIETTYYFFYCENYPIQVYVTEYDNGDRIDIISMYFNDDVIPTVDKYGKIQ